MLLCLCSVRVRYALRLRGIYVEAFIITVVHEAAIESDLCDGWRRRRLSVATALSNATSITADVHFFGELDWNESQCYLILIISMHTYLVVVGYNQHDVPQSMIKSKSSWVKLNDPWIAGSVLEKRGTGKSVLIVPAEVFRDFSICLMDLFDSQEDQLLHSTWQRWFHYRDERSRG